MFDIKKELFNEQVYPHKVESIRLCETATAMVFLTGTVCYKVNKSIDIGFLDLSTLEKRKQHCENELKINSRISPALYISVVPITRSNGIIQVEGDGEIIEYALKMYQMDPDSSMDVLLKQDQITQDDIKLLAQETFKFHAVAPTNDEISSYGNVENIIFNWNENFEQTKEHIGSVISQEDFSFIQSQINSFIDHHKGLLSIRTALGKIKHCHGDFHSGNVFITPNGPVIFDALTFNMRFPCSDVISEIAFMAMDLEYHNKKDLANLFVEEYRRISGDDDIPKLLNFYKCYRAYIRAKINCFGINDQGEVAINSAKSYFDIAHTYASELVQKTTVVGNNTMNTLKIGIIGGSGLDNPDVLLDSHDVVVGTPFGAPSSPLKCGSIGGVDVVLLARHGRAHSIPPTQVNYRANIHSLKDAGCTHILVTTACGSLQEEIGRGDFVILDQFIDFTRHRNISFFEEFINGEIKHTPMAKPFDTNLRDALTKTCSELNLNFHKSGTVITIEGPRFSTKAESHMFRGWGADVINMSVAPECALANELQIPYAAIAMSTDYDCWKEDEAPVTWEEVLNVFKENVEKVTNLLIHTIPKIAGTLSEVKESDNKVESTTESFDLKSCIRTVPNWPTEGVMFRDITSVLEDPTAFQYCVDTLVEYARNRGITKIAAIDSRGFIFGAPLALELKIPLVLVRKKGKLPGETISEEYALEYGVDCLEIQKGSITSVDNVLVVDDLIATGGTAKATCDLITKLGATISALAFIIDLPDLKGKEKLGNHTVYSLVEFEGE